MNQNDTLHKYLSRKNINHFTSESYRRGNRYYLDDKVRLTYVDNLSGEYHANVVGTSTYNVRLDLDPISKDIKKAYCNCPYQGSGDCKHIAATLLAVAEQAPDEDVSVSSSFNNGPNKKTKSAATLDEAREEGFASIKSDIESGRSGYMDLPPLLGTLYRSLKGRFYITSLEAMKNELTKIGEAFSLNEALAKEIFRALLSNYYGNSKENFYRAAFVTPAFHKAAFASFFDSACRHSSYETRSYLYDNGFSKCLLETCTDQELSSLLSTSLSSSFSQADIIEEAKRRKNYKILLSLGTDANYARSQDYYYRLGQVAEKEDRETAKALYRKMLYAYDITLDNALFYYHFLNEEEREAEKKEFSKLSFNKGFDSAFSFLYLKDSKLIKYFNLTHFAYMSPEITSLPREEYDKYLFHAIEVALNKREKMKEPSMLSLFIIFITYPKDVFEHYYLDERVTNYLARSDYKTYFTLLYERGLLEGAHYRKWEE